MTVLWRAGQERAAREARERLAELYVGVRDGFVAGEVLIGRAKWRVGDGIPAYARAPAPPRDPAARRATLAKLGMMFPGAVREGRA